jgi:DNA-binding transcriptional ArsR family regulator
MLDVGAQELRSVVATARRDGVEGVAGRLLDTRAAARVAETFKVLGDATRVRIVHALSLAELCTCDLAALLGISEPAVSHHLRTLRQMRLVRYRRQGRLVYYALDDEHIRRLFDDSLRHAREP